MVSLGERCPPSGRAGDLAALSELDEAALLSGLRERFLSQHIYTDIGDILIAVNPFQPLPLYGREVSERYQRLQTDSLPPHIFAVAGRAYHAMLGRRGGGPRNQCILVSGESGAGKTESAKLLLQQIMNLCKGNLQLEQQILQVNPLLEAFGNAQTVMNDNSSRFGKYIQLRFQKNTVRGAKLSEYLLEKSRVVQQDAGERNFHIFYYMFAGLSSEEKEMYGLLDPSLYRYVSGQFGTQDVAQRWKDKYQEVCNALDMVGFQEQEQVDMQTILAGVLSLGNVTFDPEESNGPVKVSEASKGWLKAAAGQFGVQEDELLKCLVCTMSVTRGEQIQRFHTQQQAEDARDSIAKMVYGRVFGWIVRKINELLAENVDPEVELREIGILDIFGFENFPVNRFEQLCINLANEQLQHFFNHHIFQMEQAAYKEEGLPWETITFNNNEPILNLLLAKPLGLLSLLDEQSAFPQATDKTFVDKLNSSFKGNLHFQPARGHVLGFSITHYAGKVQYDARGFLEKNRDTLPANVRGLFISSVTPLLSVLFTATVSRTGTLMPHMKAKVIPGADDKFNSTRKQSVGAQFRHSLMVLMERLYSANPHFVRCVKPNSQKEPGVIDNQMVLLQLRYNGLLETIRIRRDGFSWRPFFEEFAERYAILLVKPGVSLTKESCLEILQSTELKGWICGKSRLFFKYWHQEQLAKCVERLERAAVVIQKVYRGFRCKKSYVKLVAELRAQAQSLQNLGEKERRRQLALEAEAQKRSHFPVPMPRKRHPQPNPHPSDKAQQLPVPRPRSKLKESTPFDNLLDPSVPHPVLGTEEHTGEEAEMRKIKRGATLRWFRETQAEKVVQDDGAFPSWLHGMISRREAENLLHEKPLGCFLVRISQSQPGYILTYKGQGRCRHFMIQVQPNARYVILGEHQAHASLTALVRYHQTVGIQPFMEILTVPCGQKSSKNLDYENLEYPMLSSPADKAETLPQKQSCRFLPSISKPTLPCLRRSKNFQNQQTRDKSRTNSSSRETRQQAFPHLRSSIRLAMQEIQQFNSYSVNISEKGHSSRHR
ncbi:myosin-IIIb-like isoform X1 [Corapipo altera]|uniref:myosin-IIIb-like isoform X1 n=1 Tax=Corapipo altera TaxID=415028 RepID=UPI000FD62D53|nr:myosin-IIIb-like isoform X1 [Corapipo altera]XP_027490985.1 myosin-IIIb-like isoform X1 [Corapipo altera]